MNKKLEGLRNKLLFKLNAIGDYNTHKEIWDAFYEYEKELYQPSVSGRSEQLSDSLEEQIKRGELDPYSPHAKWIKP